MTRVRLAVSTQNLVGIELLFLQTDIIQRATYNIDTDSYELFLYLSVC